MNIVINQYHNSVGGNKLVKQLYEQYAKKLLSYTINRYSVNEDDAWTLVYKTRVQASSSIRKKTTVLHN